MRKLIESIRDDAWDRAEGTNEMRASRIVGEAGILTAAGAAALTVLVQVLHETFTRPVHVIQYDEALRVMAPLAFTFVLARDVWKGRATHSS